jgi:hypothetical protein
LAAAKRFLETEIPPAPLEPAPELLELVSKLRELDERRVAQLKLAQAEGRLFPEEYPFELPPILNKDKGWENPVPVSRFLDYSGPKCKRSLPEFLPLESVGPMPPVQLEDELDRAGEGRFGDFACYLDDDWHFAEIEHNASRRSGHEYAGRSNRSIGEIIVKSIYDLETAFRKRHPDASCRALADFLRSWQVQRHIANFAIKLAESESARMLAGDRVAARNQAALALKHIKRQLYTFAGELLDEATPESHSALEQPAQGVDSNPETNSSAAPMPSPEAELTGNAGVSGRTTGHDQAKSSLVAVPIETQQEGSSNEFHRDRDIWKLRFEGANIVMIKHQIGMSYIAYILEAGGRPISAAKLASLAHYVSGDLAPINHGQRRGHRRTGIHASTPPPDGSVYAQPGTSEADHEHFDRLTDDEIKAGLRQLSEMRKAAEKRGDEETIKSIDCKTEAYRVYLAKGKGVGGKRRKFGTTSRRIANAVTTAIGRAIKAVAGKSPALGEHLKNCLDRGIECMYRPNTPVHWDVHH